MKKRKIAKAALAVLSVMTIGAAGASFAACGGDDDHEHTYGKWTLITNPTLDAAGKAERYCTDDDGGKEEKDVPKLTDTSVWTENLTAKVDPTCSAQGKREFTSTDYGTVTVTVAIDANVHSYGKWTLTKDPTKEEEGEAQRVCGANGTHTDKKTVPALSDTSIWTLDTAKSEAATHTKAGKEVYTSADYGEVTVTIPADAEAHDWGDWAFVGDAPTLEAGGKIKRICGEDNTHIEEKNVPDLKDATFWTKTETTPATHQSTGVADFTNAEYKLKVEGVTVPKAEHTFGAWTITTKPTTSAEGEATRVCSEIDGDCAEDATATEKFTLPELENAFWTKSHVAANYNSGSVDTYTNAEYGLEVKVVADDKKVAPYDDVHYYMVRIQYKPDTHKIDIDGRDNVKGGSVLDLTKNKGTASMQPLQGDVTINSKNPDELTGEVEITVVKEGEKDKHFVGYYDEATKVIVFIDSNAEFYILTPYYKAEKDTYSDETFNKANKDVKIAYLPVDNGDIFALDYAYETGKNLTIFVENGVVTFNVTFKNEKGVLADVSTVDKSTQKVFYVHDKDDKKIAHYGVKYLGLDKDEKEIYAWTVCDGFEGVYAVTGIGEDDVYGFVNGAGSLFYAATEDIDYDAPAYYEILSDNSIGALLDIKIAEHQWQTMYYEFTMPTTAGGKVTAVAHSVTVTFNSNGVEAVDFPPEAGLTWKDGKVSGEVGKKAPIELLPGEFIIDKEGKQIFLGWYLDAAGEIPVVLDENDLYYPSEDVEFFAKWADKLQLTIKHDADATGETAYFGEGQKLGDILPEVEEIDLANWKSFEGWFINAGDGEQEVTAETPLTKASANTVIYGKWKALPVYFGEYSGASGTYDTEATISIDKNGNVIGSTRWSNTASATNEFTATVLSYDPETQVLVWRTKDYEDKTVDVNVLFYTSADHSTRILVMDDVYSSNTQVDDANFLLTNGENVEFAAGGNIGIDFNALGGYRSGRTRVVKYTVNGNERLMLLYGNKIYADVTLEDYLGNTVAHADVLNGKTLVVKQGANVVAALGSTGTKLSDSKGEVKALDFYGVKPFDGVDYTFDGLGAVVTDTTNYVYEVVDAGTGKLDVFETDGEKRVAHYVMTIDKNGVIVNFKREVAELTYDGQKATIDTKILWELPTPPEKTGFVFAGWHKLSDLSDDVITSIIIEGDTIIYADWRDAVKVTFNANGGKFKDNLETKEVNAAKDMTLTMDEVPVHESGAAFIGWFVDENTEWKPGETKVTTPVTVTAKWSLAPYIREYKGAYVSSVSETATNPNVSQIHDKNAIINIKSDEREYTNSWLPFKDCYNDNSQPKEEMDWYGGGYNYTDGHEYIYNVKITYNEETGEIKFETERTHKIIKHPNDDSGTSSTKTDNYTNYGFIDKKTGIIVVNYTKDVKDFSGGIGIMLPSTYSYENGWNAATSWTSADGKVNFYYDFTNADSETESVYICGTSVYFGAVAKNKAGERIASKDLAKKANTFIAIYASDANDAELIFEGGNNGTTIVPFDGYQNTYTDETLGEVIIDGLGTITIGGKTGKYTLVEENSFTTTVDGVYYEITVDKTAETCVVTAPKASISFTFEHATVEFDGSAVTSGTPVQHGINVKFTLPTPVATTGYQFVGWYTEAEFTNAVTEYTLTKGDEVELFAKIETMPAWASKDTAEALVFTDNSATISGETNALNLKHWTKLEIANDGVYLFASTTPVKKSSNSNSINYARYSIIKEDSTEVKTSISFGNKVKVSLVAGTYYVEVHLGGQVTGSSSNYPTYGTFAIDVTHFVYTEYTLGSSVETTTTSAKSSLFKVTLEAGKIYNIKETAASGWSKTYLYNDELLSTKLAEALNSATDGANVAIGESGVYYIEVGTNTDSCTVTFQITEVGAIPSYSLGEEKTTTATEYWKVELEAGKSYLLKCTAAPSSYDTVGVYVDTTWQTSSGKRLVYVYKTNTSGKTFTVTTSGTYYIKAEKAEMTFTLTEKTA